MILMKAVLEEPDMIEIEEPKKKSKKIELVTDIPGVGAATAEKLAIVGYKDLMSIAVATPGELVEATGMTDAAAKKMITIARANLDMGFISGEEVLRKR